MNKKHNKLYDKAIKYYQRGKINKALEVCEEALSYSLKNASILNLKGLLLYQKGNLEEAITAWRINKDFNNDNVAKNYINASKEDEKRVELYLLGEKNLKELNIDEAINLFKKCKSSDFNSIKVNTALALCYQKKGMIDKCIYHMNEALSIDKNSEIVNQIKKELIEIKAYKESNNKFMISTISIVTLALICSIVYKVPKYFNNNDDKKAITSVQNNNVEETNKTEDNTVEDNIKEKDNLEAADENTNESKSAELNKKAVKFNTEELKNAITENDAEYIYQKLNSIEEKDVEDENKGVYRQGIDILKSTGVEKFYEKALDEFNSNKYENANVELKKAYDYCQDSYLKEDIIFYRAVALDRIGNNEEAISLYDEYCDKYPKGSYTDNSLYNAALLTSSTNKEKSLHYANKLKDNFSNSIYYNEKIINLLNN